MEKPFIFKEDLNESYDLRKFRTRIYDIVSNDVLGIFASDDIGVDYIIEDNNEVRYSIAVSTNDNHALILDDAEPIVFSLCDIDVEALIELRKLSVIFITESDLRAFELLQIPDSNLEDLLSFIYKTYNERIAKYREEQQIKIDKERYDQAVILKQEDPDFKQFYEFLDKAEPYRQMVKRCFYANANAAGADKLEIIFLSRKKYMVFVYYDPITREIRADQVLTNNDKLKLNPTLFKADYIYVDDKIYKHFEKMNSLTERGSDLKQFKKAVDPRRSLAFIIYIIIITLFSLYIALK